MRTNDLEICERGRHGVGAGWLNTATICVALVGWAGAAAAQVPPPTEQLAAIDRLAPMVGDWRGSGWIQMGPDQRREFSQTEAIRETTGGTTILVEGRGTAQVEGHEIVVHDALAVISFDAATGAYRFSSHTARGDHHDTQVALAEDGSMVWGFDTPRGKVRFTITIVDATWHEVGAFSPTGEQWTPFLEMTLKRQ